MYQLAPLKKTIYSIGDLHELLIAANRRYLDFISALKDPSGGNELLDKISENKIDNQRTYKGFNFFSAQDQGKVLVPQTKKASKLKIVVPLVSKVRLSISDKLTLMLFTNSRAISGARRQTRLAREERLSGAVPKWSGCT